MTAEDIILKEYHKEKKDFFVNRVKAGSIWAIFFYPLFGFLDKIVYPDYLNIFLLLRAAVEFVLIIGLILAYTSFGRKNPLIIAISQYTAVCLSIVIMIHISNGYMSPYYAGIILSLMFMIYIYPLDFSSNVIVTSLVFLSYFIPILLFNNITQGSIFLNNSTFLFGVVFFLNVSSFYANKMRYQEFISRYNLQKVNEELKKLGELKNQFFANISHELRTPLTLMLAPLPPLIENKKGRIPSKVRDTLMSMKRNGYRLLKQINALLDLAKLEEGKMRLNLRETDIVDLCMGLLASVQVLAQEHGLELHLQFSLKDRNIVVDPDQFEKVVLNLLSNAIKFTPMGGRINLFLRDDEERIELIFEDTGEGIPSDMLDTIFVRFAQVDGSSTRRHDGTGIGLSLAREIVELHGGKISVESRPGKGSRFKVALKKGHKHFSENIKDRRQENVPVTYKKRASDVEDLKVSDIVSDFRELQLIDLEKGTVPEDTGSLFGSHEHTILVIDDNPDILRLMRFILKDEYDLLLCPSAEEGLKIIREKSPDLVICDIMMPGMDGHAFCKVIKSDEEFKHLPVMLVTARAESEMLVEGIDSGADDYLAKPFDTNELKARLRSLLRMRTIESQLYLANRNLKVRTEDLVERQRELFHSMVKSLVTTLDAKDKYTRDHSLRVTEYTLAIALRMDFLERELKDLELASLLHDVGKIAVPEALLNKSDRLSKDEFSRIKMHPVTGEDIIKPVAELRTVASIIRSHHERYDGSGYPDGLSKQKIPIGARIMAVADTYDAMTSERPYRKNLAHNTAVKEILRYSGKQFDPEIVEHFLELSEHFRSIRNNH